MRQVLFDLETDGLLQDVTKIHCISVMDVEDEKVLRFTPENIKEGVAYLQQAADEGMLIGHNIISYDLAVIAKLYPGFTVDRTKVRDTIVESRLYFPDLLVRDGSYIKAGVLPTKRVGSHALEAWGYRLGQMKGEYSGDFKQKWIDEHSEYPWLEYLETLTPKMAAKAIEDKDKWIAAWGKENYPSGLEWQTYTEAMGDYCDQDVIVTRAVMLHFNSLTYDPRALKLEHQVRWFCSMMERSGFPFDVQAAGALYATLAAKREAIRVEMMETFPPLVIERVSEKTGKRLKDKVIEFNPGSRDQIAQRLTTKYGWVPKVFTDGGKPQIDETILSKLDYPEAKLLSEYFLLEKRCGQLGEGNQAWLKVERNGRIHGSINTNGAVTGRCTHSSPNLGQVPNVSSEYGPECRALFHAGRGFKQVGADLSGLELRCLAHYMARWDGGEYGDVVLNGDVHTKNQEAAGLPTRNDAKTFIYAFLYGAGDEKIGSIVGKGRVQGKKLKERFLEGLPALGKLKSAVEKAADRGHLIGLDGRKVPIRSKHAALNTLLQGAGALISKRWVVEVFEEAERRGYVYGRDWYLMAYVHDEVQMAAKPEIAEGFGKMAVECARKAGEFFDFKCPIDAEYKVGDSWRDCH
jgi:DNA polymerase I-like protein with 3'-5' exonuclease and polymerase domains